MIPKLSTPLGQLYEGDCLSVLSKIESDTIDLAFADPPFNLGKEYTSKINDSLHETEYLDWCRSWIDEMVRVTKPGGALFLWNIPKWNLQLGSSLFGKMTFRHWISVDIKYSLPIQGRLYPSHYSLLYFIKGDKPAIFHPDRLPVPCCKHCGGELRDYGGYKHKMNPMGVSLSDVWTDIPPVRHAKYKRRDANALSLKLMDRILSISTDPGSVVLDPFGGSGTTFVAAELTGRKWIGSELECSSIVERFADLGPDAEHLKSIRNNKNSLFTDDIIGLRKKLGNPISEKYRRKEDLPCDCEIHNAQGSLFSGGK